MKVLVLGGAGNMGSLGTKILQNFPGIQEVVIADLDKVAAEKVADSLNFPKVNAIQLDANDTKKITEISKEFDVVLNTVGPFIKFGMPILNAVIDAGTDYVDVCDDHDVTEEMFSLDEKAKAAGVTAVISMGQSPGITNMQAKYTAEMLDSVDVIKVVWALGEMPVDMLKGTPLEEAMRNYNRMNTDPVLFKAALPAVWPHMLHTTSGDIPVWKDGKFDTMPAWESGEYVDFAEPLGRVPVYYVGHSEPVSLPRFIKIKDFCACLGTLYPAVNNQLRLESRGHEEPLHPPVEPDTPVWPTPEKWKDLGVWQGGAAIVEGWKNGKKVRYTNRALCSIFDRGVFNMAGQAIGVYLTGTMQNKPKGVFGPEGVFSTKDFFGELVRVTNEINEWDFTLEELLPTEREIIE